MPRLEQDCSPAPGGGSLLRLFGSGPGSQDSVDPGPGQQGTSEVSWQVHVAVGHSKVRLYVDCRKVAEKPMGEAGSSPVTGFVTLGRLAKARGPRSSSATVSPGLLQGRWGLSLRPSFG